LNGLFKETGILRDITVEIIGQKSSSTLFSILDPIKSKIDDSSKKNNDALSNFLKYDIDLIPTKEDINNYIDQVDEIKSRTERLMAKIK
jgi:ubiquinone biosynthesis protein UbiJ